jgi:hypothetical protein
MILAELVKLCNPGGSPTGDSLAREDLFHPQDGALAKRRPLRLR